MQLLNCNRLKKHLELMGRIFRVKSGEALESRFICVPRMQAHINKYQIHDFSCGSLLLNFARSETVAKYTGRSNSVPILNFVH